MPVEVERLGYGEPVAERLAALVAEAKGADPLRPVTVIVPWNHVGVAARRRLATGSHPPPRKGVAAVTFLTLYRLAELLGAPTLVAQGRRPVSTPVITAALRRALAERPGLFAPVAEHPATETALVGAYRELRDLSEEARQALSSRRAREVLRLCEAAREHLARRFYDEEDLMAAATERVEDEEVAVDPNMVVYLPQRLSRHGAKLLRALDLRCRLTVLAGATGDDRADHPIERTLERLGVTAPSAPAMAVPTAPGRTTIITTSDADEEVRQAVRALVNEAREGRALEGMAILYATEAPYARLVHEQLAAAGLPYNGASVLPLASRMAGRVLLGLLDLPRHGYRRDEVFAWLASAPIRRQRLGTPVVAWERLSRAAGVVAGRTQWKERLEHYAAGLEAEAERHAADPEAPTWRADRARRQARLARELARFVVGLIDDLEAASAEATWGERARWAAARLDDLCGAEAWREQAWPPAEHKAAQRVSQALRRLAALEEVEGQVSLETFTRTLDLELGDDLSRVGRLGEGVLVGPVAHAVGLDLDLVVVVGLAEGSYPRPPIEDSLLSEHDRRATGGELEPRAAQIARQHHDLLAALAGARRQVLTVPRGDLRQNVERSPSRFVLELASAMAGRRLAGRDLSTWRSDWCRHVASFEAGLGELGFPATAQEHRLRRLLGCEGRRGGRTDHLRTLGDPVLTRAVEMVEARRSPAFTRFDGNLGGLKVPSPATQVTSATRLESWVKCPFGYFMHEVLKVEAPENPEDRLAITPLDKGSLVHEILEDFVRHVLDRSTQAGEGSAGWSADDHALLAEITDVHCRRYEERGLVGRAAFWERDRRAIAAALQRFLRRDSDVRRAAGWRPVAAELAFGTGASAPAVALPIGGGRTVRFRGQADRIDRAGDGALLVIDYKTGAPKTFKGLSSDDPDCGGTKFQLPIYGLAARQHAGRDDVPVFAEYRFVFQDNEARVGYLVSAEVIDKVSRRIAMVVDAIEDGVFPPNPTTESLPYVDCPYCQPDGLHPDDLRRLKARKEADPLWARHAAVTGPLPQSADAAGVGGLDG